MCRLKPEPGVWIPYVGRCSVCPSSLATRAHRVIMQGYSTDWCAALCLYWLLNFRVFFRFPTDWVLFFWGSGCTHFFDQYGFCCVCVCVTQSRQRERKLETGLLVALQQHSERQLEGKQNGKWDWGGGDLGCGREKRNGLRKFLMTCCIRPFSLEDSFRAKWYKNPGTKDLATLFYRLDGVSKGSVI